MRYQIKYFLIRYDSFYWKNNGFLFSIQTIQYLYVFLDRCNHYLVVLEMVEDKHHVKAAELPICPFCHGSVFYDTWVTHRIFQMECKQCKSHWRTRISTDHTGDILVELLSSKNPTISNEYFEKQLPLSYWQALIHHKK
jgi:hypothetical protein